MAQADVFDRITDNYNSLTRSARKIADYVFGNRQEVQYMSITTLSEECGAAEATIFRFCQTLGFSGYNGFKLALAQSSGSLTDEDDLTSYEKISPQDSIIEMARKLYTLDVAAISETLAQIDEEEMRRAIQYLSSAQRVYCFGQGGSMVIAMEAWARFITVAPHFQCIEDAHMQAMAASLASVNDVVLFFSYSGATKDMQDVLRPAKARGAKIILITRFAKSPAAAFADVVLLCGSKEGPLQSGSVAAKVALLFVIDVLFNEYCRKNQEFTKNNCELTAAAVSGKLL